MLCWQIAPATNASDSREDIVYVTNRVAPILTSIFAMQCVFYNNHSFHGKTYSWESYIVDEAECELNCKPIGMDYFATLEDRVVDGTSCFLPIDFVKQNRSGRAMCVEGICKAIHNSGILTGAFMNNGAVRCGSTVCNPVSHTFSDNTLPIGYSNVATIPTGASNISILELKNSGNFLVLRRADRSYVINGNNKVSNSGVYSAAGTIFEYRRIDDAVESSDENTEGVTEWITATGPIKEPIQLMVWNEKQNPGIKYEYLMPINPPTSRSLSEDSPRSIEMEAHMPPPSGSDTESSSKTVATEKPKKKTAYVWRVTSFTACSKSCGGGTLAPIIRCVKDGTSKYYSHKRCANQPKPTLNENVLKCNTKPCPAYWKVDEWSACNCGLPNENDDQTRDTKCVQELATGIVINVNDGACLEKKPETRQECDCPKQQVGFLRHPHKHHHEKNHKHTKPQAQPITLIANSTKKTHVSENKKAGIWLSSDWNDECSTKCGEGTQYRSIFCDRSGVKNERCDVQLTPDTTQSCTETSRCNLGDWFVGPWSACFGDCFSLMRSRSILCVKNDQIVGDEMCIDSNDIENSLKPVAIETCEIKDVAYCKPKWHYAEWSECTRTCGSGTQRRTVKCLEPDMDEKIMKETDNCKYSERQQAFRSCNMHGCNEELKQVTTEKVTTTMTTKRRVEPKVHLIQNDSTPKCEDRYPNCHVVVKAQLCTYDYYTENCCKTCKEAVAVVTNGRRM